MEEDLRKQTNEKISWSKQTEKWFNRNGGVAWHWTRQKTKADTVSLSKAKALETLDTLVTALYLHCGWYHVKVTVIGTDS